MIDPDDARDYFDMVVARVDATPDDPYWARAFLEFVLKDDFLEPHRARTVRAFLAWAQHDPRWFASVHSFGRRGPSTYLWSNEMLAEIDDRLAVGDAGLRHLLLGRLWASSRLLRDDDVETATRAADHFRLVPALLRSVRYYDELGEVLLLAAPKELLERYSDLADRVGNFTNSRSNACRLLLHAAIRAHDWENYDKHRATFERMMLDHHTHASDDCEVLNFDGLRALETGQLDAIPGIFAKLTERGQNVEYLGNEFGTRLPRALVERTLHLELCVKYLEMIHAQTPRNDVAALIEEAKLALQPRNPS